MKSIHLPQEFNRFSVPTLLVITDNHQARILLGIDNTLEELPGVTGDDANTEPLEKSSGRSPGGQAFSDGREKSPTESRERLYHRLIVRLNQELAAGLFEKLILAAPEEHVQELEESLPLPLLRCRDATIPKNLTGEELLDLALYALEET